MFHLRLVTSTMTTEITYLSVKQLRLVVLYLSAESLIFVLIAGPAHIFLHEKSRADALVRMLLSPGSRGVI